MKSTQVFAIFLATALVILGYAALKFSGVENKGDKEVKVFEEKNTLTPPISLGYSRARNYTHQLKLKPDLATLYRYKGSLSLDQVGLKGVWYVESDRITSLGDEGALTVYFQAPRVFVELSGQSNLPVRIDIDGRTAGEIKVDGLKEYEISLPEKNYNPRLLTLFVPRGISAYSFRFTE